MTLNEGQGHPNWCQNEFSGLHHHTKFVKNRFVNFRLHTSVFLLMCLFLLCFAFVALALEWIFFREGGGGGV